MMRVRTFSRLAWLSLAVSELAVAQAVPPRVIVIMDTSRSMKEALDTDNPAFWQTPPSDGTVGSAGADYDCVQRTGGNCSNKFCAAKKTLCEVLTETPPLNAEIALGGYYQYLASEAHPANGAVQCLYDVLEPAGLRRTFTSTTDWTNSYTTLGRSATAQNISTELGGYCRNSLYFVTKEQVLPPSGPPVDSACSLFDTSKTSSPKSFIFPNTGFASPGQLTQGTVPSSCSASTFYWVSPTRYVTSNITYRNAVGTACEAVVSGAATGNPVAGSLPSRSPTSIGSCASPTSTGCYSGLGPGTAPSPYATGPALATGTASCSSGYPCDLYATGSTPTGGRAWYGFWGTPAAPDTALSTTSPTYTFATRAATAPAGSLTLNGSTNPGTACTAGGATFTLTTPNQRISNGTNLTAFGINAARTAVEADATIGLTATPLPLAGGVRVDQSPTINGTSFTCSATWPCDISLTSILPATGTTTTVYSQNTACAAACTTAVAISATPCVWGNAGTAGTYVTTTPTAGACAASFTATTASVAAPQGAWANGTFTNGGTAPPVDCSTAPDMACTFNRTSSTTNLTPNCPNVVNWNGVTTASCPANGDLWSVATSTNRNATYVYMGLLTDTISCPANPVVSAAAVPAGYSLSTACSGSTAASPCNLVNDPTRYSTTQDIQYTTSAAAGPPGPNYTQTQTAPSGGARVYGPGLRGCSATATSGYATVNSANCASSAAFLSCGSGQGNLLGLGYDVQAAGAVNVDPVGAPAGQGCGSEKTSQCVMCAYDPIRYQWKANKFTCTYNAVRTTLTARTVPGCSYTRVTYPKQQCLQQCNYAATAKRYDFENPLFNECSYVAISTRMQTQAQNYLYSYLTKGGELYGTWTRSTAASTVCDGTHTYGAADTEFKTACPAVVPDCIPAASELTPDGGAFTCKLRNSIAGTWSPPSPSFTYRYGNVVDRTYFNSTNPVSSAGVTARYWSQPEANTDTTRRECLMGEAGLTTPDTDTILNRNQSDFCVQDGGAATETFKLFSDYYVDNPGAADYTTALATLQAAVDPGAPPQVTVHWSRPAATDTRSWGLSLTLDGGAMNPSQIFVGIDNTTLPGSQVGEHSRALQACNLPDPSRNNVTGGTRPVWDTSTSGFCMSDDSVRDYTPLYGSLKNAGDYARVLLANDDAQWQCRKYFILLATDGREDTPSNLTSQVPTLVDGLKNLSAGGRTAQLRTYVVGIGTGAASDQTQLDAVAAAGGTSRAYTVTTQAALTATLRQIFNSLAAGTFTKSKPTISTDGKRLYYASYTTALTGERSGELQAFSFDTNGRPMWQWSASPKVNAQADNGRVLRAATGSSAMVDFTDANASMGPPPSALASRLTEGSGYPTGTAPSTIIDFIRNASLNESYVTPGFYRNNRIGPIGHSNPVVVGLSPYDSSWGGPAGAAQDAFNNYVASTAYRGTRVLLGSGDGFLRAFVENVRSAPCQAPGVDGGLSDADPGCANGKEAWGFMPVEAVRTAYTMRAGQAPLGVDGPMAVADVCGTASGASACTQGDWKTVAIGSERAGGNGIFALNVTSADDGGVVGQAPGYLWGFAHGDLGFSYSAPAIGRITDTTGDRFATLFGGGLANGSAAGTAVFVVDAIDGGLIAEYTGTSRFGDGDNHLFDANDQKLARPATHRWPGVPYLYSAFVPGTSGVMYALRFVDTNGTPMTNTNAWRPQIFWDPGGSRSAEDVNGRTATITQVVLDAAFDGGQGQQGWKLVNPTTTDGGYPYANNTFPMASGQVRPLLNRPRAVPVIDSRGKLPDLFFGTGDTTSPSDPGAELPSLLGSLRTWNYVVAVHDTYTEDNARNSGRLMWAHYFIDPTEQVVSEPAVISGGVIVATYTPSTGVTANGDGTFNCEAVGDTTLYCFDPIDGHLTNCLTYMSGPYQGRSTAVVKMGSVGVPSDLVVINNNMYFATSVGGLVQQTIRQTPPAGDVRSYRRLR